MAYFTSASRKFWNGLAKNNNKAWFNENRKEYEQHLKKPYYELAAALCEQVAELEPEYDTPPKQAVYRINRDIRFSKDKTPYKTELGITVGRNEKHDWAWPSYTCRISTKGVWIAGGLYAPQPELRDKLRVYVGEHAAELAELEAAKPFGPTFGALQGEAHKRVPKELAAYAETEPRVMNKQWVFWTEFKDAKLFTSADLDQFILDKWEIARPVQEFLKRAVAATS